MKIKTIRRHLDYAEQFDEDVNNALSAGYTLVKRYYIQAVNLGDRYTHIMLVAELKKDDDAK